MNKVSFLIRKPDNIRHEEFYHFDYSWASRDVVRVTGSLKHGWYFKIIAGDRIRPSELLNSVSEWSFIES